MIDTFEQLTCNDMFFLWDMGGGRFKTILEGYGNETLDIRIHSLVRVWHLYEKSRKESCLIHVIIWLI